MLSLVQGPGHGERRWDTLIAQRETAVSLLKAASAEARLKDIPLVADHIPVPIARKLGPANRSCPGEGPATAAKAPCPSPGKVH